MNKRTDTDDNLTTKESMLLISSLCLLLATLLITTNPVFADAPTANSDQHAVHAEQAARQWSIALDNDLYAAGSDRDYTAGIRVTTWQNEHQSTQFGLLLYTPADISNTNAQTDDRPYANLLYIGQSRWRTDAQSLQRYTVTLGVLGSPVAEALQRAVHSVSGSDQPRGFGQQISDGGELTARFGYSRYTPLLQSQRLGRQGSHYLSITGEQALSVGYLTEASIGINLRLAKRSHWWAAGVDDFVTQLDEPVRQSHNNTYWFAGARIKTRAYNALLQGQFRNSPVTFSASELRPVIAQAWVGYATRWRTWAVQYALRYQSAEIKSAHGGREQIYGAITFSH